MSVVCEAFNCTPDVAEEQDWETIRLILEYRQAEQAIQAYRQGKHGVETLQKNPQLIELIAEMRKAQLGDHVDDRQLKDAIISEMHTQEEDEPEV